MWEAEEKRVRVGLFITFIVVMVAALIPFSLRSGFDPFSAKSLVIYVLAFLYFAVGTWGFTFCISRQQWLWAYFVLETLLAAVLFYLNGAFWICLMPLTCHVVTTLRPTTATLHSLGMLLFTAYCARNSGWSIMVSTFLSIGSGMCFTIFTSVLLMKIDAARNKAEGLTKEITEANEKLREYAINAEQLAVAQERNRMAREIHDGLGHYLTVINVQIEAARALMSAGQPGAEPALAKAEQLSRDALADVRRSVGQLKNNAPGPVLHQAITEATSNSGLPVEFQIEGRPRPIEPSIEHALLRTIQEGLTNIRRHSAADRIELNLDYRDAYQVRLTLSDNGRGSSNKDGSGHGLKGLRERIELLGGHFQAANGDNGGFVLRVEIAA